MSKKTNFQILLAFILVFLYSSITQNYDRINQFLNKNISLFAKNAKFIQLNLKFNDTNSTLADIKDDFKIKVNNSELQISYKSNLKNKIIKLKTKVKEQNDLNIIVQDQILSYKLNDNFRFYDITHRVNSDFNIDKINFGSGVLSKNIITKNISNFNYSLLISILIIALFIINIYTIKLDVKFNPLTYNPNINNQLLSLRTIACFLVASMHTTKPYYLPLKDSISDFYFLIDFNGRSAVFIFFMLSGFLMGKNFLNCKYELNNAGIIKFYKNRMVQIFPIYFITIAIAVFFVQPWVLEGENLSSLYRALSFSNATGMLVNLNYPIWSISNEILFYALAPFFVIVLKNLVDKYSLFRVILIMLIISLIQRCIFANFITDRSLKSMFIYRAFYLNYDLFVFGILTNFIIDKYKDFIKNPPSNLFINSLICGMFAFLTIVDRNYNNLLSTDIFVIIIFMMAIITSIEIRGIMVGEDRYTILRRLGIYTYAIYAFHGLFEANLRELLKEWGIFNPLIEIPFILTIFTLVGVIAYYLIERPICKAFKKSVIKDEFK